MAYTKSPRPYKKEYKKQVRKKRTPESYGTSES